MSRSHQGRRIGLSTTLLCAVGSLALAATAQARINAHDPAHPGCGNGIICTKEYDVSTAGARQSNGSLDLQGGLYVIGDSISMSPLDGAGVPYVATAGNSLRNGRTAVRAFIGGDIYNHLNANNWSSNGSGPAKTTLQDALDSKASTVFVELGTNDFSCMHQTQYMPQYTSSGGCGNGSDTPDEQPAGNQTYANWRISQLGTLETQARYLIDPLIAKGICVIWAGPREAETYGSHPQDWAQFNNWLKSYKASKGNMLAYADWTAYAQSDPLKTDFATIYPTYWNDEHTIVTYDRDVHMHKPESGQALANFAAFYAAAPKGTGCGMATK